MIEPFPRPAIAKFPRCQPAAIVVVAIVRQRVALSAGAPRGRLYSEHPEPPASECVRAVKGSSSSVRVCYCKSGLCFNTLSLHMDVIFPSRLLRCLLQGCIVLLFFFLSLDLKQNMTWEKKCRISHPRQW